MKDFDQYFGEGVIEGERHRYLADRIGFPARDVYDALRKVLLFQYMSHRATGEVPAPDLTDMDFEILEALVDQEELPLGTGQALAKLSIFRFPANTDRADHSRAILASARRKLATARDETLTADEHRAVAAYAGWSSLFADREEFRMDVERVEGFCMPAVARLGDATFDDALAAANTPVVVYFHWTSVASQIPHHTLSVAEPKRGFVIERLAERLGSSTMVAHSNLRYNPALKRRFNLSPKPELLLAFDVNGILVGALDSGVALDPMIEWCHAAIPGVAARMRSNAA